MLRAVLVTASLALATGPVAGAGAATPDRAACKGGTVARISGKSTCLAKGRACASSKQKEYKKHGYSCSNGRLKKVKQEF
jgi:hypothetical protein